MGHLRFSWFSVTIHIVRKTRWWTIKLSSFFIQLQPQLIKPRNFGYYIHFQRNWKDFRNYRQTALFKFWNLSMTTNGEKFPAILFHGGGTNELSRHLVCMTSFIDYHPDESARDCWDSATEIATFCRSLFSQPQTIDTLFRRETRSRHGMAAEKNAAHTKQGRDKAQESNLASSTLRPTNAKLVTHSRKPVVTHPTLMDGAVLSP